MIRRRQFIRTGITAGLAFQVSRAADADDPDPISSNPDDAAPSFADGATSRWRFGFRLQTPAT
ncbi:MAG: hypothetical protein AAF539_13390, partial [Planctomycetota bacterium]